MNWLETRTVKIISAIVLFFFTWTSGGVFEIAHAISNGSESGVKSSESKTQKPEEKLQKTLDEIEGILTETSTDTNTKKTKVKPKKSEIESLDGEIKKQFKETEDKIKELPEEIKQRHKDFVKHYDDNLKELNMNLDAIDKAKTEVEINTQIEKTKAFLKKVKPPKKHTPLDPNKLPHRTAESERIEPRLTPEEFEKDGGQGLAIRGQERQKQILVASNGSLDRILSDSSNHTSNPVIPVETGIQSSGYPIETFGYDKLNKVSAPSNVLFAAATPPSSADLSQTIEVQFTLEITAKAEELQRNPLKIYNWVRNNIEFVPTYGSIQGANMCLQTKQCNAFDTASLLIALLRVSGIQAKYVQGTVEIPIEKVKNWVGGFTDTMSALNLLASAGIPTAGQVVGGEIKYVRIEHIWVEAYVDYIPSRGAKHKVGDTWIPLDASFKQYNYTSGIDIKSAVPFDAEAFVNQIQSTATINETEGYVTGVDSSFISQTMTDYQTQVQNYITQTYPNATVGDVLGKKEIVKQEFPHFIGTLPYIRIVTGAKYSSIPNSLRHKITFNVTKDIYDGELGTPINITKTLPELAGRRISLNYVPATDADKNLIDKYMQNYATSVPAYLVHLKAELKVDNSVIATGPSITMGTDQILNLQFISPKKSEMETHLMIAGDYNVIGLNIGSSKAIFEKEIEQNDFSDPISEMLHQTILGYWAEYDTLSDIYTKVYKVASVRLPSEGLSSVPVNIVYTFGVPYSGYYAGKGLDVKRDITAVLSLNGDKGKVKGFNQSTGMIGSLFEGIIFDQLFGYEITKGISTVKILDLANSQGIPIYDITSKNISTILPQLQISVNAKNDIKNGVNAGKEILVPKSNITHNGWTGIGYIVSDPNSGNGGYIIEGGAAGSVYMYDARMAAATGEIPFSSGVMLTIGAWEASVGKVALAEIAGTVGIDIAALIAAAQVLFALLVILMVIIIIASIVDTVTRTRVPSKYVRFRHYTTLSGKGLILLSKRINATEYEGDLGTGAYVSDLFLQPDGIDGPNTATISIELNMPKGKIQTYVELLIDLVRRPLRNGMPEGYKYQWVYQNMPLIINGEAVILVPTP